MKIKARFSNLKGKKQVFSRKEVLLKIFLSSSKKKERKSLINHEVKTHKKVREKRRKKWARNL